MLLLEPHHISDSEKLVRAKKALNAGIKAGPLIPVLAQELGTLPATYSVTIQQAGVPVRERPPEHACMPVLTKHVVPVVCKHASGSRFRSSAPPPPHHQSQNNLSRAQLAEQADGATGRYGTLRNTTASTFFTFLLDEELDHRVYICRNL